MKHIHESKKLVKEGAGAGYTVHIKGLKTGKILNMQKNGKTPEDEYYEVEVEVVPCEVEVGAENYYNDFFWQEHEWGDTPTAQVNGGVVNVVVTWYEDEDEIRRELENTELDFDFDYGGGWIHVDLPRDKPINSDHIKTKTDNYYEIFEISLNAPDLADAVNCGYKSLDDRDEEDGEFEPIEEARRKKASGTEADEETKQKMVIAMDMKGWEQQGDSLEFYNPSKDEGKEFGDWEEVYDFILELYGYK